MAFEGFKSLVLLGRPQIDDIIVGATCQDRASWIPFDNVKRALMSSPDSQRLLLLESPQINVAIQRA